MSTIPFKGRTIQTVQDFSIDEQYYLYALAAKIKKAILTKDYNFLSSIAIDDNNFSTYLLFQENSTRTKESFFNAAQFHKVRVKDLLLTNSSIAKHETFTDTVKTLLGYAEQSCFIIRSSMEGICRWLEHALRDYAQRCNIESPFCINAGDGRNEHPTQEFLDQFTFFEYNKEDPTRIHIALIGDLLHGRTIHSKCDGLKIYKEVEVDLVAPEEIAMPDHYVQEMIESGFKVRMFESIEEYRQQSHRAKLWYFTRLQLERLADEILPHIKRIRSKIIFNHSYYDGSLSDDTKFFHPLPRDKYFPTIPYSIDDTPYNGWDMQSINGYYVRIALLSMLKGKVGEDFHGYSLVNDNTENNFIEDINIQNRSINTKPQQKIGIKPVENGIVIDHIAQGQVTSQIWNRIDIIRRIMDYNFISSHGVYQSYTTENYKGIISLPNYEIIKMTTFKKLGAISPGCTINVIQNSTVIRKMQINQPPRIYNFTEISCRNPRCVSHVDQLELAYADFYMKGYEYFCVYCKTPHDVNEIWNTSG